jgi:hypothetical protein
MAGVRSLTGGAGKRLAKLLFFNFCNSASMSTEWRRKLPQSKHETCTADGSPGRFWNETPFWDGRAQSGQEGWLPVMGDFLIQISPPPILLSPFRSVVRCNRHLGAESFDGGHLHTSLREFRRHHVRSAPGKRAVRSLASGAIGKFKQNRVLPLVTRPLVLDPSRSRHIVRRPT